jgi:16S rRNA C1402 (ribose-2'-O) methylase RsmI
MINDIFKTNIVFGALPIGNPHDISLNNIMHINNADIILIEHEEEFQIFIDKYNTISKNTTIPNINVKAKLYKYNLEDGFDYCYKISRELIDLSDNKKILCLSDEGSSLFLEPTNMLKHMCIEHNRDFSVLSGPNSVISALTNSIYNFSTFIFLGTFDNIVNDEIKKEKIVKILNIDNMLELSCAFVFLINGPQMKDGIKFLYDSFNNDWLIDFSINLTTKSETHFNGTIENFYNIVKTNMDFFINSGYKNRFAITLISKKYQYVLQPENKYNINKLDNNFIFKYQSIHEL